MTAMSSAGLRAALATEGTGSSSLTDSACGPRRPSATPKSTLVPGLGAATPAGSAEACRKTSSPSSLAMKPKPRSVSNHLTLPVGTGTSKTRRNYRPSQFTGRIPHAAPPTPRIGGRVPTAPAAVRPATGPGPPRTGRARTVGPMATFSEHLRARSDPELVDLLARRPDLANPSPSTLASLAARATSRVSLERALAGVDASVLQVLESVVALHEPGRR